MKQNIFDLATKLFQTASIKNINIVTAESCTGGLLSAYITSVSGSSKIFCGGFITYSSQSKMEILDIPQSYLNTFGSVSSDIAMSMASGALNKMHNADLAISITGHIDPVTSAGHSKSGHVYICCIYNKDKPPITQCRKHKLDISVGREKSRNKAIELSIELALEIIG